MKFQSGFNSRIYILSEISNISMYSFRARYFQAYRDSLMNMGKIFIVIV